VEKIKLFNECKDKADWCSNPAGQCILIVFGECANCPYFLGKTNKLSKVNNQAEKHKK